MSERSGARLVGRAATVALVLLVSGCAAGPDFQRPRQPVVDRYDATAPALPSGGAGEIRQTLAPGTRPAEQWWHSFESISLDETVNLALHDSPTLAAANAVLAAAREALSGARGALLPQADLAASSSRGNSAPSRSASATPVTNLYSVGPSISYGLDLFGGTRRRIEQQAALADYEAAEAAAAYLALTGNVVTTVIDAAAAAEQLAAANEIVTVDERNLALVQQSMAAGKSAGTDVLAAESQLASDRALIPPIEQQADVARHALAVLVGRAPGAWTPPDFRLDKLKLPAALPLTLPSELAHARPDILAAEAQWHAASAAVGIATAQMYPSLTLSGAWTSAAASGSQLFQPGSDAWSVAASLAAPIFHGGALRAQRRAAVDTLAAQLAQYRAVVLQAFAQVADALNALQHDAQSLAAQRAALEAARASLDLTQQSFQAGQGNFLQILDAQRLYQQARLGLSRAQSARYLDTAQLILALGGDAGR